MKKTITLAVLLLTASSFIKAQSSDASDVEVASNCYQKWAMVFEKRGAFDVEDGVYNDVIITFRRGGASECFDGKVEVEKGHLKDIFIKYSDASLEKVVKKYKNDPTQLGIVNGMSATLLTMDEELINVLFVKKIKPKKKEYKKAAEPKISDY